MIHPVPEFLARQLDLVDRWHQAPYEVTEDTDFESLLNRQHWANFSLWHEEDLLEIHPTDAENRGLKDGAWVKLASRTGETTLRATVTVRVAPGVVYTTFHHPATQANVVTSDYSDWATNCPEYKVTAVQVTPSNGPTDWQESYSSWSEKSRRIASDTKVEPAE